MRDSAASVSASTFSLPRRWPPLTAVGSTAGGSDALPIHAVVAGEAAELAAAAVEGVAVQVDAIPDAAVDELAQAVPDPRRRRPGSSPRARRSCRTRRSCWHQTDRSVQNPPQSVSPWAAQSTRLTPAGGAFSKHTPLPHDEPGPQTHAAATAVVGIGQGIDADRRRSRSDPASAQVRIRPSVGGPTMSIWAAGGFAAGSG